MREKRKLTEPRMHTRECERRLALRIQAGGRDHDMWIETCGEKDVEVPPIVFYWLNMLKEWGCIHEWDCARVRVRGEHAGFVIHYTCT